MTIYAVKLYQDEAQNPQGLPGAWPSQAVECTVVDENSALPSPYNASPWIKMTQAQLDQQRSDNQAAYNTWFNAKRDFFAASNSRRDGIKGRMDWGQIIILDFRDYAVAKNINPTDSLALLSALSGIMPCLELGLLTPAAYLLGTLGANSFLDSAMDGSVFDVTVAGGTTVKQYFVAKILEGA